MNEANIKMQPITLFILNFGYFTHFRVPSNQKAENDANDNRPSSPSSVESNEDDELILEQVSHF